MKLFYYPILLIVFLFAGCNSQPTELPPATPTSLSSSITDAQDVLVDFFTLMNTKKYAEGDALYGGSYEMFQGWNPDIDPSDHVMLWTKACKQNGLQCLLARTVTFKELQGDSYLFQVEFSNPDGSLFVLGPCCGADETEMPPVSQFEYRVSRNAAGKFVVMDPPPYVP